MGNVLAIVDKELRSYFVSPIAYVVMTGFLLLTGFFFFISVMHFQQVVQMAQAWQRFDWLEQVNLHDTVMLPLLGNMSVVLMLVVPLVTMRLIADEKKQKTDELLMTSPISVTEIVLGKFIGSWLFMMLMLAATLLFPLILVLFSNPDLGPIATGYLGIAMLTTVFVAVGLFASSVTQEQLVAAVIAFVIILGFYLIGWPAGSLSGGLASVLEYLSIASHFESLAKGVIETKDLGYFATLVFSFLFLTWQSLESTRYR